MLMSPSSDVLALFKHVPFVISLVKMLVSEEYLYEKMLREGYCHVAIVMQFTYLIVFYIDCKGWRRSRP